MSLHPQPVPDIPAETARVVHAALPKGNTITRLRDTFGTLYHDDDFAALYPARGQPAYAPWRLALVTVLQFLDHLTDRQAAEHVRTRLDWKYALSLELTDTGFDFSVLCEFRTRLVQHDHAQLLFDRLLTACREQGLVKARGKQRTDSTHVLARVRALNRLELVAETLRVALDDLAGVEPDWLTSFAPPEWFVRYGRRIEEGRLPHTEAAREALALTVGTDGYTLLHALGASARLSAHLERAAVRTLWRVWLQQFQRQADSEGQWTVTLRASEDTPPSALRIASPHEIEARYSVKRTTRWEGYKVQLSESCEDDTPHLITSVLTTPATVPDWAIGERVHADLTARDLLPSEHFVDSGYIDGPWLASSEACGVDIVGPPVAVGGWQAKLEGGLDVGQFEVDWEARHVTCPAGHRSVSWSPKRRPDGREAVMVRFGRKGCGSCALRERCTRAKSGVRSLTLLSQGSHEALVRARERVGHEDFARRYHRRAGVEGTVYQGVRAFGMRVARYRGLARVTVQETVAATSLNVLRVMDWLNGREREGTRTTSFARLRSIA